MSHTPSVAAGWKSATGGLLAAAVILASSLPAAQTKQPPTPADFGQWERLTTAPDHGGLSPDGKWLAYGIARSNRENELRVTRIADGLTKTFAYGAQPTFSADSKWLACAIGLPEAQEEKIRKDKKPIHRQLGVLNLTTGESATIDAIESFAFSPDGHELLMQGYRPDPSGKDDKDAKDDSAVKDDPEETPGAVAVVRDLASGRDTTFGNVAEAAWQNRGRLLALAVAAADRTGNGLQIFDPESSRLRVLDSSRARYVGLAWRRDADDLAVLRSRSDDGRIGASWTVLAWTSLGAPAEAHRQHEATLAGSDGAVLRTVAFRRPTWSDDGRVVFIGVAPWRTKPAAPAAEQTPADGNAGDPKGKADEDDRAAVDVWHSQDVEVMPRQKVNAKPDREQSLLAAWHLESDKVAQLQKRATERVAPLHGRAFAYAVDWTARALDRSWGRFVNSSLSLVSIDTGERTTIVDRLDDRFVRPSPGGKYLLYYLEGQYWVVDVARRSTTNITKAIATSFVDRESDSTDVQRPWFGYAGWTTNDESVLLYDKFDVWQVSPDGTHATRLTDGAAQQTEYRWADAGVNRDEGDRATIDRTKPLYFAMSGLWSKKSGYARLDPGSTTPAPLVWTDRSVERLARARNADVYQYVVQSFEDSPDAFVGSGDLKSAVQVTHTNPFQDTFAWGHSELVDYRSEPGVHLQGVLRYPANYEPGRRYPMVVYVYEKRSDTLHQYSAPSERDYYNAASFTSAGYFWFEPDIVFRPREPGVSVVECVRPAVAAVVQKGLVDAARVGIVGHSWGGFDTAYLATHTTTFAAAVAGAPITDLISNYGNHHWGPGIAETDHIETGQQRMVVPVWEDVDAYARNSAVFGVGTMTTPLLIEVGDADGTVFWHQGVELYNAARRAKKQVVLLVYANEDHGLRQKNDQIDYHRRILEWFGHYLKGDPAPAWIDHGVSYLERQRTLDAAKAGQAKKRGGS